MLKQPMIEKLLAMRLHGMAESLKTQEQDPAARDLSFLERLGLLVDQQWNWRENQALGRRLKNAKLRTNACVEDIDYRGARGLDKSVIRALVQESAWVGTHENVFVLGPTGVGKSFVRSCAEGLPRWVFGPVHPRPVPVPRPGDGARGWQPPQSTGAA
jgi:DNA replication protein DnaC